MRGNGISFFFFFSSRRRHTRCGRDWSSDVCSSDLAGRPRLPIRLMASLLYLKHSFDLSDEELVARWSENIVWQFFSGREYYEARPPCDASQVVRFRRALGEDGLEQLLKATIECAVEIKAVKSAELERVIVDSTVQEKA